MRRPSPTGLLIALALSVPVLIELRTVLVWIGVDIPLRFYAPAAVFLVVLIGAGIWVLSEDAPREA